MIRTLSATLAATALIFLVGASSASAHCQVPCGIYDDHARVHQMHEDARTVAKAIAQIAELAGKTDAQSQNQLVRWINTKEDHAIKIQQAMADYFLTQRVVPVAESDAEKWKAYTESLALHHAVIVAAMKARQGTDPALAEALTRAIDGIAKYYPPAE
jgi:nickel superoxide dismutase